MDEERAGARDWVAIILALGLGMAINTITAAVLYDAITHPADAGLSENATQVLTTAFGGMIGVLGSYVGYRFGARHGRRKAENEETET